MALVLTVEVDEVLSGYSLPTRMKAELKPLVKGNLSRVLSSTRVSLKKTALKTQERRLYTIFRTLEEIRELGYKIESPYSLSGKHLEKVVKRWVEEGQAIGTIQTKLSHLKAFAHWMGKFKLVKSLYDYVPKETLGDTRKYVTTTDKSWAAHGVDAMMKIAEIEQDDPHVAMQLKLQAAFGLRIEESFSLPVAKTIQLMLKKGDGRIVVDKGTKGSRPREVPVQLQIHVLTEALKYANPRTGSTTPGNFTIRSWRNHYNWVMRKHGITKDDLGITSHGLRHEWLQEYYKALTGVDAPIKGSNDRADIEVHRAAMKTAIEAVGHSRPEKTGMYMSTYAAMDRLKAPVFGIDDVRRALEETGGDKKAAAGKLGISRQRLYRILEANERGAA
jgi:integrase